MKGNSTTVQMGPMSVVAVLTDDANYYVTVQSLATLFQLTPNNATKTVKALLGETSSLLQISLEGEGPNKSKNNCIALKDFELIAFRLALKGNEIAAHWVEAMVGLSLTQLCADAFGVKFEAADRQAWLTARMQSKETRRLFTDAAQDWYVRNHGAKPDGLYYAALTNRLYTRMFGKTAEALKQELGVPSGKALRDYLSKRQLADIEAAERLLVRWVDSGTPPDEALTKI